jgi:hypothetical protein
MVNFDIVGKIENIEIIAKGPSIRDLDRLRKMYGFGNWRKMKGIARVRPRTGRIHLAELHCGMKKSKKTSPGFVVCINNENYPASLELHKIYRVIPDEDAVADGDIRVIDESGEDYLYPASYFAPIKVPQVEESLLRAP